MPECVDVKFPDHVKLALILVAARVAGQNAEAIGIHIAGALFAKPHKLGDYWYWSFVILRGSSSSHEFRLFLLGSL